MRTTMPTVHRGVSLVELMVAIGVIVVLLAIILPVLSVVRAQGTTASSMNNMRQIATWMSAYERDNREFILPSQFDYNDDVFVHKGRVRSEPVATGIEHHGTWADILWTINNLGPIPVAGLDPGAGGIGFDYRYDAPDKVLYEFDSSFRNNPLRSPAANSQSFRRPNGTLGTDPKPHGNPATNGANEMGFPGFYAANDFFDVRPNAPDYSVTGPNGTVESPPDSGRWWTTGQIRAPERSMYLISSFAGEVIAPIGDEEESFDNRAPTTPGVEVKSIEVDFRYAGHALMLMLDGSVRPEGPWRVLEDLEEQRGLRVRQLDRRSPSP